MSEFEKSLSAICDSVTKTAAYAISYAGIRFKFTF